MYCWTDVCDNESQYSAQLCQTCHEKKWGPEPAYALPVCLIDIVSSYYDPRQSIAQCCKHGDLEALRYVLGLSRSDDKQLELVLACHCFQMSIGNNCTTIPEYIMDRFGNAWQITQSESVLRSTMQFQMSLVLRFPPVNQTFERVIKQVLSMTRKDDELCYWFLTQRFWSRMKKCDNLLSLLKLVCELESVRCVEYMASNSLLETIDVSPDLLACIHNYANIEFWSLLWKQCRAKSQTPFLLAALNVRNVPVLDFLHSVSCDFSREVLIRLAENLRDSELYNWTIRNFDILKQLWDVHTLWLSPFAINIVLRLCADKPHDDVVVRLLRLSHDRLLIDDIVNRDNWDLFFKLLAMYPVLKQHVNWYHAYCRASVKFLKEPLLRLSAEYPLTNVNAHQYARLLLYALAHVDHGRVCMVHSMFHCDEPFSREDQNNLLTDASCKLDSTKLLIGQCQDAMLDLFVKLVGRFDRIRAKNIFLAGQLMIRDIRKHVPMFVVNATINSLDKVSMLNWIVSFRDVSGDEFTIHDLRRDNCAIIRCAYASKSRENLQLRLWLQEFKDVHGEQFERHELKRL